MLTAPFSSCAPNFQEDNGLPVHLKGGATDNILYRVTMTLCLGGECTAGSRWRGEGAGSGARVSPGNWILSWCGTTWEPGLTDTEGAPQGLGSCPRKVAGLVMHLGRKPEAWSVPRSSISPAEGQFGKGLEPAAWAQKQDGAQGGNWGLIQYPPHSLPRHSLQPVLPWLGLLPSQEVKPRSLQDTNRHQ